MIHPANRPHMTIGQLAERAGVNAKTIRYYESIGLLPPPRRAPNGYREYAPTDATRLLFIRRAQSLGLSLAAVQDILALQDAGLQPCHEVREAASTRVIELNARIAEMERLRDELQQLADRASQSGISAGMACEFCPAIINQQD